ncbi:MAG: ATP-binding protein [Planctomycetaceae bacterium]|nr:ATP-binding protein [Planctomycetaceae bacterium]
MIDYERLGVFYLGKEYDLAAGKPLDQLLLYESRDLCTHAVCVGMTGSGKTGLCLALLEEAAIDGIPALIIDPKGDLGNLLLTFPQLRGEDFQPWVDPADAKRGGISTEEYAAKTAQKWKQGLAEWGQPPERIQKLQGAVDVAIYTPGSTAGLPLTVLRSFDAPSKATLENSEALRETISAAVSGLLGLVGIETDPLQSREHILLSNIIDRAWRAGKNLDMGALIRAIQTPGFDKLGVLDLDSSYPPKERYELAMQLNNLLASPGFSVWMEGEPLDIQRLLYTPAGKPRMSILSIAHLTDAERMFFVTILLSEVIAWMRTQSGTSSLRALLYMDEVFGYFPPSANPPSKRPMLTLLKQARAFGLGVVLATQNPVDLDYKGLANCGTWLLGRLQTERDKLRVLDGLEGASTQAGTAFDRARMDRVLSGLASRVFLMNNVHEDQPVVFRSRWAMSYLRGPLTREQISQLMRERKGGTREGEAPAEPSRPAMVSTSGDERPLLPPDIVERFIARRANLPKGASVLYRPALLGTGRVHFAQASTGVDIWQDVTLLAPIDDRLPPDTWSQAEDRSDDVPELENQPEDGAKFGPLPGEFARPKRYLELAAALKDSLYRSRKLAIYKCASPKGTSTPDETEAEFRVRLSQSGREQRDEQIEKLRRKYAPKIAALEERVRKAQVRVEKEKSQASEQTTNTVLSFGASVLSALFGRKLMSSGNITRATSSMRKAGKIMRERQDVSDAAQGVDALNEQLAALNEQFEAETQKLHAGLAPDALELTEVLIKPKKSDISVTQVALVWQPWIVRMDGAVEPGV